MGGLSVFGFPTLWSIDVMKPSEIRDPLLVTQHGPLVDVIQAVYHRTLIQSFTHPSACLANDMQYTEFKTHRCENNKC